AGVAIPQGLGGTVRQRKVEQSSQITISYLRAELAAFFLTGGEMEVIAKEREPQTARLALEGVAGDGKSFAFACYQIAKPDLIRCQRRHTEGAFLCCCGSPLGDSPNATFAYLRKVLAEYRACRVVTAQIKTLVLGQIQLLKQTLHQLGKTSAILAVDKIVASGGQPGKTQTGLTKGMLEEPLIHFLLDIFQQSLHFRRVGSNNQEFASGIGDL